MERLINEMTKIIQEEEATDGVPIFFTDLDESAQKQVMNELREALNVSETDEYADAKIYETLSGEGNYLFMLDPKEVARRLNFDF